jgi:hypothetical protein
MTLLIRVITICKLLRVFHGFSQVEDYYYMVIPLAIQSIGRTPLSQSIEIQNPTKSPFSNVDLCGNMGLGMEAKTRWQLKPHTSPMLMSLSFCRVNEGICKLWSSGTSPRICPLNKM